MERRAFLELGLMVGIGQNIAPSVSAAQVSSISPVPGSGVEHAAARLVTAPESRPLRMNLGEARLLVGGPDVMGAWWMARFREDPGFRTNYHVHRNMDEQFFVLKGVLSVNLDGRWHDAEAGTIVMIPRGTPHAQGNYGKEPTEVIGSGNPSGFEGFLVDQDALLSRLAPSDPQVLDEIAKLLPKYDTQPLGPPPSRP